MHEGSIIFLPGGGASVCDHGLPIFSGPPSACTKKSLPPSWKNNPYPSWAKILPPLWPSKNYGPPLTHWKKLVPTYVCIITYTLIHIDFVQFSRYTSRYFLSYFNNIPTFHNLSIIYRIKPLPYNLLLIYYGRQVYHWNVKAYKRLCKFGIHIWRQKR